MIKEKPFLTLEDAINKCNEEYILPYFQRDYVWDKNNVKGFLDSLFHKWPTGSLIIWKKPDISGRMFGPMWDKPKDTTADSAVIDGQQRLTTLKLLRDNGRLELNDYSGHKEHFCVFFDLENEEFVTVKDEDEYLNNSHVDIQDVLKNNVKKNKYRRRHWDNISNLKKLLNYQFPVIYTHVKKDEDAIEIFNRVNTAGKKIDKGELAYSILKDGEHSIAKKIVEFQKSWIDQGFDLSNRIIINSFLIVKNIENEEYTLTTRNPDKQIKNYLENNPRIIKDWKHTKEMIEDALKFLKNDTGFDSFQFLTSENVVATLCGYFKKNGNLDDLRSSKIRSLKKWLYQTIALGRYTYTRKFLEDLENVQAKGKLKLEKNLPKRLDEFSIDGLIGVMYAIGINRGMRDYSGNKLNWTTTNQKSGMQIQVDHIYPFSKLKKSPISDWLDKKLVNSIGNKAFIQAKTNKKKLSAFPGEKIKNKNIYQWVEAYRFLKDKDYKNMCKSKSVFTKNLRDIEDFITSREQKIFKSIKKEL